MRSNSKITEAWAAAGARLRPVAVFVCLAALPALVLELPVWAQGNNVGFGDNDFLPRSKSGKHREPAPGFDGPGANVAPGTGGPNGGPGGGPGWPPQDGGPNGGPGFGGSFGGPGGPGAPGSGFNPGGGPGGFSRGPGGRRHGMGPLDLSSLNLTEEQKSRIKAQRAKSAPRAKELMAAIRTKKTEMRDLMFDPAATGKQILDKRQELKTLQDESETLMLNDFIAMRGVLTTEQLKHLPELKPGRGLAQRPDDGPPGPPVAPDSLNADSFRKASKGDKSK